jgi:hypothetical protein
VNIEIIGEEIVTSIKFPEIKKEMVDIDTIFRETNKTYPILLESLGLITTFDFTKRSYKRLYTHEFIKTFVEFIKNRGEYTTYFFSDSLTKDPFRNSLIKKLKRIFGVLIWEDFQSISDFSEKLVHMDCGIQTGLELFFNSPHEVNFRKIKKNLDKEGLTYLHDIYFENVANKLHLAK